LESTLSLIPSHFSIQILGDGAMSRGYQRLLNNQNRGYSVYSRKLDNWGDRNIEFDCRINTTAIGTINSDSPLEGKISSKLVIDLSIKENQLTKDCEEGGIKYIGGMFFYKEVFLNQFEIYTKIQPDAEYFDYLLLKKHREKSSH
jgi:shikimate 5-dehydrogenase